MRFFDFEINLARILNIPESLGSSGKNPARKHPDEDIDGAF